MKSAIHEIYAREILDSRGLPAIEAEAVLENGIVGTASVAGGNDLLTVLDAIAPELEGLDVIDQLELDRLMREAAPDASGAATLAVSLACARAAAAFLELPLFRYLGGVRSCVLPIPLYEVFSLPETGKIRRILLLPDGAGSFRNAFRMGMMTQEAVREANLQPETVEEATDRLLEILEQIKLSPDQDVCLIPDVPDHAGQSRFPAGTPLEPATCKTVSGVLTAAEKIHRSGARTTFRQTGSTADDFLADLAVAMNAAGIEPGLEAQIVVSNRLLRIEEMLGDQAEFGI